jgi:flagellar motility protein MotE (MotC chaperone)
VHSNRTTTNAIHIYLICATVLFSVAVCAAAFQFPSHPQSPLDQERQDRILKEANKKRQQEIREDTEKLYHLATDLKSAVEKTDENMLSLDVLRKADQVEKLAKRVKEKMKEAVGPTPHVEPVPDTPYPGRPPR